jgi:hypothetical protein
LRSHFEAFDAEAPTREPRSHPRTPEMSRRGGGEDGTPWWIAAILVAIFGIAMFLSGLIVGHHLG